MPWVISAPVTRRYLVLIVTSCTLGQRGSTVCEWMHSDSWTNAGGVDRCLGRSQASGDRLETGGITSIEGARDRRRVLFSEVLDLLVG